MLSTNPKLGLGEGNFEPPSKKQPDTNELWKINKRKIKRRRFIESTGLKLTYDVVLYWEFALNQ